MKKYLRFNAVLIILLSLCMLLSACKENSTVSENDTTSGLADESGMTSESSKNADESAEKPVLGADGGDFTIGEIMDALEYNIADIMKFEGNASKAPKGVEGYMEDGDYIVVTKTPKYVEADFHPIITNSNSNVAYPGGLLLANSKVLGGVPQALDVKRGSSTIYINFADGSEQVTVEVTEANAQNTQAALNNTLEEWYTSNGGKYRSGTYGMSYTASPVYDAKMLQLALGIDEAFATNTLDIEFDKISSKRYSYYVIEFKETMYVASAAPFNSPEDAFDASVTAKELLNGGVNNANPPAYVNAVEYGRRVYMVLKSTEPISQLTNFVNEAVCEFGLDIDKNLTARYSRLMNNTVISIVDTANANSSQSNIPLRYNTTICKIEPVELSASNPAVPLDYSVVMLKDNAAATISGSTEYIAESCESFAPCNIHLKHTGAYVAEFNISWEEITGYDAKGNPIIKCVRWENSNKNVAVGYETVIILQGNCQNINIEARGSTGLAWEPWRTSFKKENLPLVPDYYLQISGTTLNQKAKFETR